MLRVSEALKHHDGILQKLLGAGMQGGCKSRAQDPSWNLALSVPASWLSVCFVSLQRVGAQRASRHARTATFTATLLFFPGTWKSRALWAASNAHLPWVGTALHLRPSFVTQQQCEPRISLNLLCKLMHLCLGPEVFPKTSCFLLVSA